MIAKIFRMLIFVLFPSVVLGQSLNLSVSQQTSGNDVATFQLEGGKVSIGSGSIQFLSSGSTVEDYKAFGVSPDYSKVIVLQWDGEKGNMLLYGSAGDTLNSYSTITLADEASFGVYPFNNGNLVLRDKIANFTFYDTFGEIVTSVSSSSQSKEGEAISELVMSANGETVVVYSPKIKRNGELGSKAMVMKQDDKFNDVFFDSDRYLKNVTISADGDIIALLTAKEGADDQVRIMDKFGNELNTITVDERLVGASFADEAKYITLYSGGRVMVYSTLEGESLGATSFRSSIFLADYFPDDNLILALTGRYSERTGVMNGAEFRAINLEKRAIESKEFPASLGFNKAITPRLTRTSAGEYKLEGGSKVIEIKANF